jgi:Peptidase family M28
LPISVRSDTGTALCLLLAAFTIFSGTRTPTKAALRFAGAGDVERAMSNVRSFARAPRPAGSAANASARQWIVDQLSPLTSEVDVQEGTACDVFAGVTYCGHVHNVLVRFGGTAPALGFALVAHYDSVFGSPGAADDGAGVATLLEVGRRLAASPHRNNFLLVFSDGEEDFLRGASLLSGHRWARGLKGAANFEARGVSGPSALFFMGNLDEDFLSALGRSFNPSASSALVRLAHGLPNDSDATVLERDGIPAVAFAFADGLEHYHRASDSADNLSPGSVAHHLDHAAVLVSQFSDLPEAYQGARPKVYFDLLGAVLVSYPAWLARALGIAFLSGVLLFLRHRPLLEVGRDVGRVSLLLFTTGVLGLVATVLIVATRTESRPLSFTVVCAALLLQSQLWKPTSPESGAKRRVGVVVLWALAAGLWGLLEPQMSYLVQWPALGLLLSEAQALPSWGRFVLRVLSAASAVVLWSWWAYTVLVAAGDLPGPAVWAACFGATLVQVTLGGDGRRALSAAAAICACVTVWTLVSGRSHAVVDPQGLLADADTGEVHRVAWNPQVDPWALRLEDRGRAEPLPGLLSPTLVTESVVPHGDRRRIVLRAQSRRAGSHLVLRELSGTQVQVVSVNEAAVGSILRFSPGLDRWMWLHLSGDHDSWRLQFAGVPPEGVRFEMEVAATAKPVFEVRDASAEPLLPSPAGSLAASFARATVQP